MELERTPAMSRRRLCAGTGISPATVQKSVRYLQDKGILSESVGFEPFSDRMCHMLSLSPNRKMAVIDLSGHQFSVRLVDTTLTIHSEIPYLYDSSFPFDDNLRIFLNHARHFLTPEGEKSPPTAILLPPIPDFRQSVSRLLMPPREDARFLQSMVTDITDDPPLLTVTADTAVRTEALYAEPLQSARFLLYLYIGDVVWAENWVRQSSRPDSPWMTATDPRILTSALTEAHRQAGTLTEAVRLFLRDYLKFCRPQAVLAEVSSGLSDIMDVLPACLPPETMLFSPPEQEPFAHRGAARMARRILFSRILSEKDTARRESGT